MFMFCFIEFFASGILPEPADKRRNDNDTGYGSHYAEIPVSGMIPERSPSVNRIATEDKAPTSIQ